MLLRIRLMLERNRATQAATVLLIHCRSRVCRSADQTTGGCSLPGLWRRQVEADVEFLQPLGRDRRRRPHHQIARLLVHREDDDLADVRSEEHTSELQS